MCKGFGPRLLWVHSEAELVFISRTEKYPKSYEREDGTMCDLLSRLTKLWLPFHVFILLNVQLLIFKDFSMCS